MATIKKLQPREKVRIYRENYALRIRPNNSEITASTIKI